MYMYLNIVEQSLVRNSQVPIISFILIKSNFTNISVSIQPSFVYKGHGIKFKNLYNKNFYQNW